MKLYIILLILTLASLAASRPGKKWWKIKDILSRNPMMAGEHFEGDMLIPKGRSMSDFMTNDGIMKSRYLWTDKRVIYQLDPAFTRSERRTINNALNEIMEKTCLRFILRTNEADYVCVVRGTFNTGCSSYVGKQGGGQTLNLQAPGCVHKGIVAHEFIHALGFHHEQSRLDRDLYVTINWENIQPAAKHNFGKYTSDKFNNEAISYDYQSLMHYGAYYFAINPSVPTIITPNGANIGQRNGLSVNDAAKIRNMYKC